MINLSRKLNTNFKIRRRIFKICNNETSSLQSIHSHCQLNLKNEQTNVKCIGQEKYSLYKIQLNFSNLQKHAVIAYLNIISSNSSKIISPSELMFAIRKLYS